MKLHLKRLDSYSVRERSGRGQHQNEVTDMNYDWGSTSKMTGRERSDTCI